MIDYNCITEVLDNLSGDLEADFLVGLFAAPVDQGNLNLVAGLQEFGDLAHLDRQVVGADLQAEAHLLHVERLGGLAVLLQLLGPLVIVLAPVNDLADWRIGVWRDLHQVEVAFLRYR